nr:hypothetical protein [Eubacterium sp.]
MINYIKTVIIKLIFVVAIAIGAFFSGTIDMGVTVNAATTPVKVIYNDATRHNMKVQVNKTTAQYLSI